MGGYTLHVTLDEIFGSHAGISGYGLIMATGPDDFLGAGKGFRVLLHAWLRSAGASIASIDEGDLFIRRRRVDRRGGGSNGDESDQARGWRL